MSQRHIIPCVVGHLGCPLGHKPTSHVDNACNQVRQEAQNHPDGHSASGRVEVGLLGGEVDKAVEDANTEEDERENVGPEELFTG